MSIISAKVQKIEEFLVFLQKFFKTKDYFTLYMGEKYVIFKRNGMYITYRDEH
jgi:hypothetical protein